MKKDKKEIRKTFSGRVLTQYNSPINIKIHTKVPEKWIFIDTENANIYAFSGIGEEHKMFRKANLSEVLEAREVIEYIKNKIAPSIDKDE